MIPLDGFTILMEGASFLALNKLSPIPVQSDRSGDPGLQGILKDYLRLRDGKAPGFLEAVHRLDRRCSGVVLFASSKRTAAELGKAFSQALVCKTYWAVVDREPETSEGRLEHLIAFDPRSGKARALPPGEGAGRPGAKAAALRYRVAGRSERYILLEIVPETGRSHQIRAQLSAVGLPIRGDLKYGARRSTANGMIMLHARSLQLPDPREGQPLRVEADPPADEPLWAAFGP
jgi:23S rRNA pseudouridine1911/1915/1917 synthase